MTARPRLRPTTTGEQPAPRIDPDSAAVLAEAIDALASLRTPYWLGDAGVRLHALTSLLEQARRQLPDAVAQARDQGLTWHEIGQLLGITATAAARHYRNHP
jgi:hypothetical protein